MISTPDPLARAVELQAVIDRSAHVAADARPERDRCIRAAAKAHGTRPVARALGLSPSAVSLIANRKDES